MSNMSPRHPVGEIVQTLRIKWESTSVWSDKLGLPADKDGGPWRRLVTEIDRSVHIGGAAISVIRDTKKR
jgi:hypothetical protein